MTTEEKLLKIHESESLMEEFYTHFVDEMNSDDEPYSDKTSQIIHTYFNDKEQTDNMFITLCGWSIDTLCNMTLGIKK